MLNPRMIVFLAFFASVTAASAAFAAGHRDDAVQRQMDCVDSKIQKGESIDWNNICSTTASLIKEEEFNGTYSAEGIYVAPESSPLPTRKHTYEIAIQGQSMHYQDRGKRPYHYSSVLGLTSPDKVQKDGEFYGGYVAKAWTFYEPLTSVSQMWQHYDLPNFVKVEAEAVFGSIEYDSFTSGKISGYDAWQAEARVLAGYDFVFGRRSLVTPYMGFGYHRSEDDAGAWEDFEVDRYVPFKTTRNVFYVPVGVETLTKINDKWDIGTKLEADPIVWGWNTYNINEIPGAPFSGIDLDTMLPVKVTPVKASSRLKGGVGLRASLKLVRKFDPCDFYIEPFFRFWYVKKSEPAQETLEGDNGKTYVSAFPDKSPYKSLYDEQNTSTIFGLRTGVQF